MFQELPVGPSGALGDEHEFAAGTIWGVAHVQYLIAMRDQA
jgi:hypothetical protein